MDDGVQLFLLLIFVFWILEGIARARQRQRPQLPDMSDQGASPEQPGPVVHKQRAPLDQGQRAPSLLEVLAAEMERAKQAQRPRESPRAERPKPTEGPATARRSAEDIEWMSVSETPAREAKGPAKRVRPMPRRPPARGTEASRSQQRPPLGSKGPAAPPSRVGRANLRGSGEVLRGEREDVVEQFAEREREGQTSDTWASGKRDAERGAAREGEQGAPLELERATALEAKRSATLEAAPSARRAGLQRAGIKESQRPLGTPQKKAPKPAPSLDPRHLIGASSAELRRILVLQEVLGPPLGLREELELTNVVRGSVQENVEK